MTSTAFTKVCYRQNANRSDIQCTFILCDVTVLYSAQVESANINNVTRTKYSTTYNILI